MNKSIKAILLSLTLGLSLSSINAVKIDNIDEYRIGAPFERALRMPEPILQPMFKSKIQLVPTFKSFKDFTGFNSIKGFISKALPTLKSGIQYSFNFAKAHPRIVAAIAIPTFLGSMYMIAKKMMKRKETTVIAKPTK